MKLWTLSTLCTASLLILSGCATSPTPPKEIKIDTTLPKVEFTKNGVVVDMKTVAFEWMSIKDPRVEGIYIYKQNPTVQESAFEEFAVIKNRFTTHYVDRDVKPGTIYQYKFRTFSKEKYGLESKIISAKTLPLLESVSWIHSIAGMPRSAKIIWRPHSNERVNTYVIERKTLEDEEWEKVDTIVGRLNAEYIDEGLKDNFVYIYRLKAITYDGIVSNPSHSVKVVTKPLPESVDNIKTTNNLAKKIKVSWDASREADFELYHVYRANSIDGSYELVAKLHNSNSFVDEIAEDGKSYFYRVSVVDKDGLESEYEKNSIHGMSRTKPSAPALVDAKYTGTSIELVWSKADPRTKTFVVERTQTQGWFDTTSKTYEGIKSQSFSDTNLVPQSTYKYIIYGVDKDGIKSPASIQVKVKTPESMEFRESPRKKVLQKEVKVVPNSEEPQETLVPMENLDLSEI